MPTLKTPQAGGGGPEDSEKTAGRLVSAVRDARGLTQREVASRLGRSRAWVSMVEAGQRGLHLEEVPSWADALQVDAFLLERLVRGCRGLLWRDGEWEFYKLGITDLTRAEGVFDEEEAHAQAMAELAAIVNQLADPMHDRKVASPGEEGVSVRSSKGVTALVPVSLPLAAVAVEDVPPQGTRADVEQLLERLTDQQTSLVAAFMRGLLAQARTRSPGTSQES